MQDIVTVGKQQDDPPLASLPGRRLRMPEDPAVADALARERRRIAADVHDLVMQDLAFALASARSLANDPASARRGGGRVDAVVAAGERALAGARLLIDDLLARDRRPVIETIEESARAAARGVSLSFDARGVSDGDQPDGPTLDALVHIAREAVTNAVKHAGAQAIEVALERGDEWRLRVKDDGRGCAPGGLEGFGLVSMRRHAQALGGLLIVTGEPLEGTTVEAVLP